ERGRPDLPEDGGTAVIGGLQGDGRTQLEGPGRPAGGGNRQVRGRGQHPGIDRAQARLDEVPASPRSMTPTLVLVILVALSFDFFNGFHDAANSIATVVSTRVLSPSLAVVWAAVFNFVAFLIFGTKVASTIAKGVVDPEVFTLGLVFAGLIGAIVWDLITWYFGLPTSSSHALIGGMAGAAVAKAGWHSLIAEGFRKIAVFIVLSPIIGLLLGFTILVGVMWIFHRVKRVDRLNKGFRRTQLLSAAAFSLGHGGHDAQKTMGVILALLIAGGVVAPTASVPLWVVLSAHAAIGLGTLSGGWR